MFSGGGGYQATPALYFSKSQISQFSEQAKAEGKRLVGLKERAVLYGVPSKRKTNFLIDTS